MAKKIRRGTAFTLLAIGIILIVVFGKPLGLFSTLPSGEFNSYGNCEFITNVDPINQFNSFNGYNEHAWISIDVDGDGVKERFGWRTEGASPYPTQRCGQGQDYSNNGYDLLVEDFIPNTCTNGEGDDIYYKELSTGEYLYVCKCHAMLYQLYKKNYQTSEAVTDCSGGQPSGGYCGDQTCNEGENAVNCDVDCNECTFGDERCENGHSIRCSDTLPNVVGGNKWIDQGLIDGECGYTSPDCINEETQCIEDFYYVCAGETWDSQGRVDGNCGYEGPIEGGVEGEVTETSLNTIVFTIGDFQIKLWMLLLLIAAIVVLVIIK